jgi:hypothetical protein
MQNQTITEDKYTGEFDEKGHKNGYGEIVYKNGDVYEGDWKDDRKHGYGKMKYSNGNFYEGDWKNDRKHGFGMMNYSDGNTYEGDWVEDMRHRIGKLYDTEDRILFQWGWENDAPKP